MKVTLTGRHVQVTPGLREFTLKKASKLEEYFASLRVVHIILSVEKYLHTAEISFKVAGRDLSAKKSSKDMYASIEGALDALTSQAQKLKDKLHSQSSKRKRAKPATIRGRKG